MSDDIARLLYQGAVAVTEGRKDDAQQLLMRVVELDESNELGWLWLSGAVDDPADQQVALENVLAINPQNAAAREGLDLLQVQVRPQPIPVGPRLPTDQDPWKEPVPLDPNDVLELDCWECGATLYSVAKFCWQCHAPVHCCNNCAFRYVSRCKEIQGLTNTMAQSSNNSCPWWRPPAALQTLNT